MDVVVLMTASAAGNHTNWTFYRFAVAGMAPQPFMGSIQNKVGLCIMVETPVAPAIGIMANPAFCPQAPPMLVIRGMAAYAVGPSVLVGRSQMTGSARGRCMQSDKREFGYIMIKEDLCFPTGLIMALVTSGSLLSSVYIIVFMTLVASAVQLFPVQGPYMTRITVDLPVSAFEWELGLVMIEENPLPTLRPMAGLAFLSVAPSMFVVVFVTTVAGCRQLLPNHGAFVTRIAFDLAVLSPKGEPGLVMVKDGTFPIFRCMAVLTLLAVKTVMNVVQPVAGKTGHGHIFVTLIWVTAVARNLPVLAPEGKFGFLVPASTLLRIGPSLFYVAVLACRTQPSTVGFIFFVTIDAFRRCLPKLFLWGVAFGTVNFGVRTF